MTHTIYIFNYTYKIVHIKKILAVSLQNARNFIEKNMGGSWSQGQSYCTCDDNLKTNDIELILIYKGRGSKIQT